MDVKHHVYLGADERGGQNHRYTYTETSLTYFQMNVTAKHGYTYTETSPYLQVKVVAINLDILTQKHFLLAGKSGVQKHRYTYTETQLITQKHLLLASESDGHKPRYTYNRNPVNCTETSPTCR